MPPPPKKRIGIHRTVTILFMYFMAFYFLFC